MKRLLIILFLIFSTPASFAEDPTRFVGIWAVGGVKKEGPALFLFPDGKAYFNAMCGKAAGSWEVTKSPGKIEVKLQEESMGPVDNLTLQFDSRGWLVREKTVAATVDSSESIASSLMQELEKTKHDLPKIK